MSLQGRLSDLITAIGADIKALQNRVVDQRNASTANQVISGNSDTYITGSMVNIPQGAIKVGTTYRCRFNAVKTAAGTAAPSVKVLVGTAGTTADSVRSTLTFASQTAVVDEGVVEVDCVFRASGASAIVQSLGRLSHRLAATGLANVANSIAINTGAAFDVTGSNLKIGVSLNPGASGNWTLSLVSAELVNLTP